MGHGRGAEGRARRKGSRARRLAEGPLHLLRVAEGLVAAEDVVVEGEAELALLEEVLFGLLGGTRGMGGRNKHKGEEGGRERRPVLGSASKRDGGRRENRREAPRRWAPPGLGLVVETNAQRSSKEGAASPWAPHACPRLPIFRPGCHSDSPKGLPRRTTTANNKKKGGASSASAAPRACRLRLSFPYASQRHMSFVGNRRR